MNKKGFTLIELLAIIVILSIITIIASTSIINSVKNAALSAKKNSAKSYIKNINDNIAEDNLNSTSIPDGTYDISYFEEDNKSISGELPSAGYVTIKDQRVDNYSLLYTSHNKVFSISDTFSNVDNIDNTNIINVKDYNAVGDGVTNDTDAIQNAINDINEHGGILYFPYGSYLVSAKKNKDSILNLKSKEDIMIQLSGSTIKVSPNEYPYYDVIKTNKCNNVIIRDGNIVGDRIEHNYTTYSDESPTHEFGYGIYNYYSKNVLISNMNISQMTGDAIINKTGTTSGNTNYTLIENSELSYSRRQGLSVLDTDIIKLNNVYIHHIGSSDGISGTLPKSGIDIEPASGTKIVNSITLDNVTIKDTESFGIVNGNSNSTNDFIIKNSSIIGLNIKDAKISNTTLTYKNKISSVLTRCEITNSNIFHYAKGIDLYLSNTKIDNTKIVGLNETEGNRLYIQSGTIINNSVIKNFLGKSSSRALTKVNAGIVNESREEFNNNLYDNVVFINSVNIGSDYTFSDKNSTIKNSFIGVYGNQNVIFNNINFENISFSTNLYNGGYNRTMYFNNCVIVDSSIKDAGKLLKVYNNSKIIKDGVETNKF